MVKSFRKTNSADPDIQQLNQAIDDYVRPLTRNPLLDGITIQNVTLSTSEVSVPHKLGRPWIGWIITRRSDGETVYEGTQINTSLLLVLQATGTTTVDLYVF